MIYIRNKPLARLMWVLLCAFLVLVALFEIIFLAFIYYPIYWLFTGKDLWFNLTERLNKFIARFEHLNL